jgi:hypothetical protein
MVSDTFGSSASSAKGLTEVRLVLGRELLCSCGYKDSIRTAGSIGSTRVPDRLNERETWTVRWHRIAVQGPHEVEVERGDEGEE